MKPDKLPDAKVGKSYHKHITAEHGAAPYTFAVTGGALPPGLTLAPDGNLSGTPTSAGVYMFTVTATDSNGCTGSRNYTLTVKCERIEVKPDGLPDGKVGHAYSKTITAEHGTPPYTFAVTSGSLPPGLTLDPDGTLSGTPTASGTSMFTIQATDTYGCTGSREYRLKVKPH